MVQTSIWQVFARIPSLCLLERVTGVFFDVGEGCPHLGVGQHFSFSGHDGDLVQGFKWLQKQCFRWFYNKFKGGGSKSQTFDVVFIRV